MLLVSYLIKCAVTLKDCIRRAFFLLYIYRYVGCFVIEYIMPSLRKHKTINRYTRCACCSLSAALTQAKVPFFVLYIVSAFNAWDIKLKMQWKCCWIMCVKLISVHLLYKWLDLYTFVKESYWIGNHRYEITFNHRFWKKCTLNI